jgi:hypothetical protein
MKDLDYHFFKFENLDYYVDKIYHYTSPEGLLGILENNSLHFSHMLCLNDKCEQKYTYELILEVLNEQKQYLEEELYNLIRSRAEYTTSCDYLNCETEVLGREDFYVMSFSQDNDNLSLWNNYTKSINKTGYNIQFTASNLVENIEKVFSTKFVRFAPVCYDKQKQKKALTDCILEYNHKYKSSKTPKEELLHLMYEFIVYSLFFKYSKFDVEKECRIVISNISHVQDKNIDFYVKDGLFIPYLEYKLPECTDVENRLIEEIKISPICNRELTKYSLNKLLNKTKYHFVPISYSDIPLRY